VKGKGRRALGVVNRHPLVKVDRRSVAAAVGALDAHAAEFLQGCPAGELSVAFLTDDALAGLHKRFLGDPSATDVITFGGNGAHAVAGEICVSLDAAVRHAGRGAARLSREVTLYVVHGWLHLAGFDDRTSADRVGMRSAEARAMRILSQSGALLRFKLANARALR
jgi:probable rRNA maturation factor